MRRIAPVLFACVAIASQAFGATPTAAPTPTLALFPGSHDRTFGDRGAVVEPPNDGLVFVGMAIQPDGKILAVDGGAIFRYDVAGTLDRGFGDDGMAPSALPIGGWLSTLAITGKGDIVAAGTTGGDFAVSRYTPDGALAATFAGGLATTDVGEVDAPRAVFVQDDRIVVVGSANGRDVNPHGAVVLTGHRLDGTPDPTFGDGGITRVAGAALDRVGVAGALQEPDGSIVVAATMTAAPSNRSELRVRRFDRDGHAQKAFTVVAGFAAGAARQSDGTIMVNGVVYDETGAPKAALVRFDADGDLDDTFGERGVLIVPPFSVPTAGMAIDARDRVILADLVVSRRLPDGALDPDFHVEIPASTKVHYNVVALQQDGKIVASGGGCFRGGSNGTVCIYELHRYEADRTQFCGDADHDGDGSVSVSDGVAVLRAAAGLTSACSTTVCDVDGNGAVTVTDGVNVLRAAADLPAALSCGIP